LRGAEARRSNPPSRDPSIENPNGLLRYARNDEMDCFAEPVIGRAQRGPVDSQ
jgi:hypothetical protein